MLKNTCRLTFNIKKIKFKLFSFTGFFYRVENWDSQVFLASFAWSDSAHNFGSVFERLLRVIGTLFTSESLDNDLK